MPDQDVEFEHDVQRELTRWFIDTDPIEIALVPYERIRVSNGGFQLVAQTPRAIQRLRLCEVDSVFAGELRRTDDGIQRDLTLTLLGMWDAIIQPYDRFTHDDAQWEVLSDLRYNNWERRATVVRRGTP